MEMNKIYEQIDRSTSLLGLSMAAVMESVEKRDFEKVGGQLRELVADCIDAMRAFDHLYVLQSVRGTSDDQG